MNKIFVCLTFLDFYETFQKKKERKVDKQNIHTLRIFIFTYFFIFLIGD